MSSTNTTGYLFQHIAALMARQSEQVLQERLGIGFSQFKILRALQVNPQMKQRHIAYNLGQTEASISRQVKLMIADGLLVSRVSQHSRREHITVPTARGVKLTDAAVDILGKYHAPTFRALTDKQREQLQEMLEIIHTQICTSEHPHTIALKSDGTS
jgi:DNA-binding MarR family transcriptional regulator